MTLQHARVISNGYILNIVPTSQVPLEFNFKAPALCARSVIDRVRTASGRSLRNCVLAYSPDHEIARITGIGLDVLYAPPQPHNITMEQLLELRHLPIKIHLGTVMPMPDHGKLGHWVNHHNWIH